MADKNETADEPEKKGHRKQRSIHKRRGLEFNNPGMFSDNTFETARKKNSVDGNERSGSQMSDMFDSANIVDVHPGDMVQIKNPESNSEMPEIGMVHYVETEGTIVGIELEGPVGKADGTRDGHRYFKTPPNCA